MQRAAAGQRAQVAGPGPCTAVISQEPYETAEQEAGQAPLFEVVRRNSPCGVAPALA